MDDGRFQRMGRSLAGGETFFDANDIGFLECEERRTHGDAALYVVVLIRQIGR